MKTIKWNLDPTHSEITFKVKHMMISNVTGKFKEFTVDASSETEDFHNPDISFATAVSSIDTGNDQRDTHLKSADFFEVEKFPLISFTATDFVSNASESKLKGNLKIKDITKPVELGVDFAGIAKDPWGNTKAGFTITGKFKRSEFGLNWNAALEAGGVLVSDEIKIAGEIQLVKA